MVTANQLVKWEFLLEKARPMSATFLITFTCRRTVAVLNHCPDCWEMLNSRGQNFLHVSILNNQKKVVRLLLKHEKWHILADEKDNDGNTPLHLLAASHWSLVPVRLRAHPSAKKMSFNKENQTPFDVAFSLTGTTNTDKRIFKRRLRHGRPGRCDFEIKCKNTQKQQRENKDNRDLKGRLQDVMNLTQVHLVVAALLVTVTFAAGFTLPGGFDSDPGPNKGMAILIRKTAFRAFVVSDAIAFTCSAGAVFSYFLIVARAATTRKLKTLYRLYKIATTLQLVAISAVVIAFVTGMYATLANSVSLAVTVCVIGCISFLLYFLILITAGSMVDY
ncbi:protein ACCELERATED CELL DEATH 6-like [Lycium ferocissimum]|uniref:protein ACCELERATED CELL DEATH 6-like n=1 Tax=Lycium ferocissimum TaxID=112874 RepID=UPI002815FF52|nr:protein ACCELERATED CELL DEATH 6-like [Lycium ferocissimum]